MIQVPEGPIYITNFSIASKTKYMDLVSDQGKFAETMYRHCMREFCDLNDKELHVMDCKSNRGAVAQVFACHGLEVYFTEKLR